MPDTTGMPTIKEKAMGSDNQKQLGGPRLSQALSAYVMSKMKIIISIVIATLLAATGLTHSAERQVSIQPKWSDLNPDIKECDGFSDDSLIIKIKNNTTEITQEVCSSYGKADAKIIKDTRGVNYLILKTAQGRGTHVTSEYLSIYRIEKHLEEYARLPVSEPVGRLSAYSYDYKIMRPKRGGLRLILTLNIKRDLADADWFEWLPKEKKRIIQIK